MSVSAGDVLRVVVKATMYGHDILNVYHLLAKGTDFPDNESLMDYILDWADDAYRSFVDRYTDAITWDSVQVTNVTQEEAVGEEAFGSALVGTADDHDLPPAVSPLVLFPSDTLRSQGRKFLPPPAKINCGNDGSLMGTMVAKLIAWSALIMLGMADDDWELVPGNYRPDSTPEFAEWKSAIVPDAFATQRRRYVGSGS